MQKIFTPYPNRTQRVTIVYMYVEKIIYVIASSYLVYLTPITVILSEYKMSGIYKI